MEIHLDFSQNSPTPLHDWEKFWGVSMQQGLLGMMKLLFPPNQFWILRDNRLAVEGEEGEIRLHQILQQICRVSDRRYRSSTDKLPTYANEDSQRRIVNV